MLGITKQPADVHANVHIDQDCKRTLTIWRRGGLSHTELRDFMVHFRLSDAGEMEFESLGEATEEAVFEQAYPVLEETLLNVPCAENRSLTPSGVTIIQ